MNTKNVISVATYFSVLLGCFWAVYYYRFVDFKLSLAWLLAGIVTSQIAIDLGKFSSPESKGRFSAVARLLGAAIAVAGVYLII